MPDNKKHHYVPRFYLKNFSENKRSICVFNIKNEKFIENGSLKSQCYIDYFYGEENTFEKALSKIEGEMANIFRSIIEQELVPPPLHDDYLSIIYFILIQQSRTKYAVDSNNEAFDKFFKHLYSNQEENLQNVNVEINEGGRYSIKTNIINYPILLDLSCKLLKNKTEIEFITSDNPLILYNKFLNYRTYCSNIGLSTKGLQIFFPISPKYMLVFFDTNVYKVGSNKDVCIDLTVNKDIYELNKLQLCSAFENIYFSNKLFNYKALLKNAKPYLREEKTSLQSFKDTNDINKELVSLAREEIRCPLDLSFLSIKREEKEWLENQKKIEHQPIFICRNNELYKKYEEFQKLIEQNKYEVFDFLKFLEDRYTEKKL